MQNIVEEIYDDFDREIYWQEVPDKNSCSIIVAEGYFASGSPGSNSYGYYNGGWEYRLLPLNSNLSQRGNDLRYSNVWKETENTRIYVGTEVVGKDKDRKLYKGRVINFSYKEDDNTKVRFIWIFNEEDMTQVPLIPSTVRVVKRELYRNNSNRIVRTRNLEDIYKCNGRVNEAVDIFDEENEEQYYDDPCRGGRYNEFDSDDYLENLKREDVPYRNAVLKYFGWPAGTDNYNAKWDINKVIKRLDDKFYTKLYKRHYILINSVHGDFFVPTIGLGYGAVKGTSVKKYISDFLLTYSHLMGMYNLSKFDIEKDKYSEGVKTYTINDETPVYVFSYKCIYMMIKTIENMYRKNITKGLFQKAFRKFNGVEQCWNINMTNPYYKMMVKFNVLYMLFAIHGDDVRNKISRSELIDAGFSYTDLSSYYDNTTYVKSPLFN